MGSKDAAALKSKTIVLFLSCLPAYTQCVSVVKCVPGAVCIFTTASCYLPILVDRWMLLPHCSSLLMKLGIWLAVYCSYHGSCVDVLCWLWPSDLTSLCIAVVSRRCWLWPSDLTSLLVECLWFTACCVVPCAAWDHISKAWDGVKK